MPSPGADPLVHRIVLGAAAALGLALAARRLRALSADGAAAAVIVGATAAAAGWDWVVALVAFFLTGSAWSRVGRVRKESRTAGVLTPGGERDAAQVAANGGLFALCAVGWAVWRFGGGLTVPASAMAGSAADWTGPAWRVAAAGALAAAAGDTWATEIGTLWGKCPRSILTARLVPPGTSGGVTAIGTLGGVAGAACLGGVVWGLGWGAGEAVGAFAGGVGGMVADSLLGASVQRRRWCERCNVITEREVHDCNTVTRARGGLPWLNNDGVNVLGTLAGAGIAILVWSHLWHTTP